MDELKVRGSDSVCKREGRRRCRGELVGFVESTWTYSNHVADRWVGNLKREEI